MEMCFATSVVSIESASRLCGKTERNNSKCATAVPITTKAKMCGVKSRRRKSMLDQCVCDRLSVEAQKVWVCVYCWENEDENV